MTQPEKDGQPESPKSRRGGAPKPYPTMKLEDVLILAKTIVDEGVGDQMRRLTLFSRLGRSPDSGTSRALVIASSKYGLTTGSYRADHLTVTEDGKAISASLPGLSGARATAYACAIESIPPFAQLYNNLKNQRVPSDAVLRDELAKVGIRPDDLDIAGEVFLANARFIGLVQEVSGSDRIIPIEQVLEEDPEASRPSPASLSSEVSSQAPAQPSPPPSPQAAADPSMHIDIQIHIDSSASSDQIDKIFSSMAKYLYGRDT